MTQSFNILAKLPSLNEVNNANRRNRFLGAKMKKDFEDIIIQWIRFNHIRPVTSYPVTIKITYYEPNKRRDTDNIESSQKFILDALQKSEIIKGDSPKYLPKAPTKEIVYGKEITEHIVRVEIIDNEK